MMPCHRKGRRNLPLPGADKGTGSGMVCLFRAALQPALEFPAVLAQVVAKARQFRLDLAPEGRGEPACQLSCVFQMLPQGLLPAVLCLMGQPTLFLHLVHLSFSD